MARSLLVSIALTLSLAGCHLAPSETVPPTNATATPEPSVAVMEDDVPEATVIEEDERDEEDDRFVVTLSSRCADTWRAKLVREDEAEPASSVGYDVRPQTPHELNLRRGDSLLFTTPRGGIVAMSFDDVTDGYDARVEVSSECSGVRKTTVRRTSSSAAL